MKSKFIALALLALCSISTACAQQYSLTDLGTLGGTGFNDFSESSGINASGVVIGDSQNAAGDDHAFTYTTAGGMVDLGSLGGPGTDSVAYGINSAGTVVGYTRNSAGTQNDAFSYSGGVMTDLGTLGGNSSNAWAINSSGTIVGDSRTGTGTRAFSYTTAGGMVNLGSLGGNLSEALAINNSGTIAGDSITAGGEDHAFSYTTAGGMVDLGTLGGTYSYVTGINSSGTIVGDSYGVGGASTDHAFSYTTAGGMVDIGTLGGARSNAWAINDLGAIVGDANDGLGNDHAFLYVGGVMVDLNSYLDAASIAMGFELYQAYGINDAGQISGWGVVLSTGDVHAFLLTPVPEPASIVMLIGGLSLLGLVTRRKREISSRI